MQGQTKPVQLPTAIANGSNLLRTQGEKHIYLKLTQWARKRSLANSGFLKNHNSPPK